MAGPASRDLSAALLAQLDAAGPRYLSGAELGATLGVSRAAVWKRIEGLRAAGYGIEARRRAGYRLQGMPDILTPARVLGGLDTRRIGRDLFHYVDVTSTMTVAADLAAEGAAEGAVVVAECQSRGRGRLGRSWHTAPSRGIWMTVILRPPLTPMELAPLTLMVAVAVADGIAEATGLQAGIKWPNDLLLDGRKVCGILTELAAEQDAVRHVLVGIGLNVHHMRDEFPADLRETATSLTLAAGRPVDRVAVFQAVLTALDREYEVALAQGFEPVLERWRARSVTLHRRVTVVGGGRRLRGVAEEVTPQGGLVVRAEDGKVETVLSGDVTLDARGA